MPTTAELRALEARLRSELEATEAHARTAELLSRGPSSGAGGAGEPASPARRPMGGARFVPAEAPRDGGGGGCGLPPVPSRPAAVPAAAGGAAQQQRTSRALRVRADVDEARHLT